MSDKELLELAATAYGLPLGHGDGQYFYAREGPLGPGMYGRKGNEPLYWSSLDNDGDALRLAVKLRIEYIFASDAKEIHCFTAQHTEMGDWETFLCDEQISDDPCAALRRAITRAAAEIARTTDTGGEA
ncbi:MAG: hypothetical protein V4801_02595 [Burkholderia gladioli]